MFWYALALLTLLFAPSSAQAQPADPKTTEIALVTVGPRGMAAESFGHSMLQVKEPHRDLVWNWGVYSFEGADFLPRFVKGELEYKMKPFKTEGTLTSYEWRQRTVRVQHLDLDERQRGRLLMMIYKDNHDPTYLYDPFIDNCSTRIRDLIDAVTNGAFAAASKGRPAGTFRSQTWRVLEPWPLYRVGIDLLLGANADRDIDAWEAMFLPEVLESELDGLMVDGRPLVSRRSMPVEGASPTLAEAGPRVVWAAPAIGFLIGGLIAVAGRSRWGLRLVGGGFVTLIGVIGLLVWLAQLSAFNWVDRNVNVLVFTPLPLGLVPALWRGRGATLAWICGGMAGLALIGGAVMGGSLEWALMVLPGWGAVVWWLRRPGP